MRMRVTLVVVALGLLSLAWVFSTPPFGAPDESAHYLRALSITNGRLLGPREGYLAPTAAQTRWVAHDARGVLVPARLSPPGATCRDGRADIPSRGCVEVTYTGDYEPLAYLLPAVAIGASHGVGHALWAARLVSALCCLAFLALAVCLLWADGVLSVLGLLAAISPMTLFIASVVNPNGLEIAAGLAFAAALLRICRAPAATPRWVYGAAGAAGAATLLAWQLGWVFAGADVLVAAALLGGPGLTTLLRARRRALALTAAVLLIAAAVFVIYGLLAGALHGSLSVTPLGPGLRQGVVQLRNTLYGAVGVFGTLSVGLPRTSYWVWWLLVLAIAGAGLLAAGGRERMILLVVAVVALAFPVLFFAWVYRYSGFGLQARYVMPLLALIPMVGGELAFRGNRLSSAAARRWLPAVAVIVVAGSQLRAWWINSANASGRPDQLAFALHPRWSPPLGWAPWSALAILGAVLLLVVAVLDVWRPSRRLRIRRAGAVIRACPLTLPSGWSLVRPGRPCLAFDREPLRRAYLDLLSRRDLVGAHTETSTGRQLPRVCANCAGPSTSSAAGQRITESIGSVDVNGVRWRERS